MVILEDLAFDNHFAQLGNAFFSRVSPTPFEDWSLAHFNPAGAELLGLAPDQHQRLEFTQFLTGLKPWLGSDPLAMIYAGHQFGVWVPQLGDGRALLLGQIRNSKQETWDIQIKGGGQTPYSRFADGRAVLRSTIREYLASEAMHALGIPTTRALAIFQSSAPVYRETTEKAALLVRLAESHVRFGSFELFFSRQQNDALKTLADYVIDLYYPEARETPNPYAALYQSVVNRTAEMIAGWQAVGFCHGVMNTDNMSVLGLTLDYGPFGFMERYDPDHICNHSDHGGRYAFHRQPDIALWNLACFGNALLSLIPLQQAQEILESFYPEYERLWRGKMREKLGLLDSTKEEPQMMADLLKLMANDRVDYPIFFRKLSQVVLSDANSVLQVRDLFLRREKFDRWWRLYRYRIERQNLSCPERSTKMQQINPKYVLRNYIAQMVIERAESGDMTELDRVLKLVQNPFAEHPEADHYAGFPPDWADSIAVSCSS